MAIPRIIHQIASDKNNLHPAIVRNIDVLKSTNAGWDHRLYDQSDMPGFIEAHYGAEMLNRFYCISSEYRAARSDFFRYLLLYQSGGVYIDSKSTISGKLDDILSPDDNYLLSHWNNLPGERYAGFGIMPLFGVADEYQQWHIVASPRHPFLGAVIDQVKSNIESYRVITHGVGRFGVWRVTGPIAYSLAINKAMGSVEKHMFRIVDIEDLGFRYSIFDQETSISSHQSIYGTHYSLLREPLVSSGESDRNGFVSKGAACLATMRDRLLWKIGNWTSARARRSALTGRAARPMRDMST